MVGTQAKYVGQVSFISLTKESNMESIWKNFCQGQIDKDPLLNPSKLLIKSNWGLLTFREFENKVHNLGNSASQGLSYYQVYIIA